VGIGITVGVGEGLGVGVGVCVAVGVGVGVGVGVKTGDVEGIGCASLNSFQTSFFPFLIQRYSDPDFTTTLPNFEQVAPAFTALTAGIVEKIIDTRKRAVKSLGILKEVLPLC
jgi:hypothetical protein